jgi:hypothetical protein
VEQLIPGHAYVEYLVWHKTGYDISPLSTLGGVVRAMGATANALPPKIVRTCWGFWPRSLVCTRRPLWIRRPPAGQEGLETWKLDSPECQTGPSGLAINNNCSWSSVQARSTERWIFCYQIQKLAQCEERSRRGASRAGQSSKGKGRDQDGCRDQFTVATKPDHLVSPGSGQMEVSRTTAPGTTLVPH